jgi:hypothetical protein
MRLIKERLLYSQWKLWVIRISFDMAVFQLECDLVWNKKL